MYFKDLLGLALVQDIFSPPSKPPSKNLPPRRSRGFFNSRAPEIAIAVMAATGVASLAAPVLFMGWVVIGL